MKLLHLTLFSLILSFAKEGAATSLVTPEDNAVRLTGSIMADYKLIKGHLPSSWEEMKDFDALDTINHVVPSSWGFLIQDQYQFVSQSLPYPNKETGGRVVLIRTTPTHPSTRNAAGRYVICLDSNGDPFTSWLGEEVVQKMLKEAGITIVPKPGIAQIDVEPDVRGNASNTPYPIATPTAHDASANSAKNDITAKTGVATKNPSTGILLLISLAIVGLLAGAVVFLRRKK